MASIEDLQKTQSEYDREYWDVGRDDGSEQEKLEKLRHQEHHLAKKLGTLAGVVETAEHGAPINWEPILDEVIPDLFTYALQMANLAGSPNVETLWRRRMMQNIARIDGERQKNGK